MSNMATVSTCGKCGLSYRDSLIPHQCAGWTKGRKEAKETQPMSDTLPEGEDQMITGEINKRWCDECKGVIHAPWCAEYGESAKEVVWCPMCGTLNCVNPANHQAATSEHEPAARGGGDKWRKVYDGPSRPMIETSDGKLLSINQFDAGRWVSYEQEDSDIDTIVTEHNTHHSLVAERERLRRMLATVIDAHYGINFYDIGSGDGIPKPQAGEIAEWWRLELCRLEQEYKQQRSTSE